MSRFEVVEKAAYLLLLAFAHEGTRSCLGWRKEDGAGRSSRSDCVGEVVANDRDDDNNCAERSTADLDDAAIVML